MKAPNIRKIAQEAGVSTQTVSRVLNNRPDVSKETRRKVQETIKRFNYEPSAIARSLIRQRSFTLGVVASHLNYYGPTALILELDRQALKRGYSLLPQFIHDGDTTTASTVKTLLSQQVDGILWAVPSMRQPLPPFRFESISVPIISVGDPIAGVDQAAIIDEERGVLAATEHLLTQGYRHIGIITGPPTWMATHNRLEGWKRALMAADLDIAPEQIVEGDWSAESGEQAFYRLLDQYPKLDAVFVCNDQMALGVLLAAHRSQIPVPTKLGVVGFDDFPESAYFLPPLTTVRQPWVEKCSVTVQELIRVIEENLEKDTVNSVTTRALIPELIIRESSVRINLKRHGTD